VLCKNLEHLRLTRQGIDANYTVGEVENECTRHKPILCAISKVETHLTKFLQKLFCTVF